MKQVLIVILFSLVISCNPSVGPTIAGSETSGGTEVVGNEVNGDGRPGSPGGTEYNNTNTNTNAPKYTASNKINSNQYRFKFEHPNNEIALKKISIENQTNIQSNNPNLFNNGFILFQKFSASNSTIITMDFQTDIEVANFQLYFGLTNTSLRPDSIILEALINNNWVEVYKAENQNDSRANFYVNTGATSFIISTTGCPMYQSFNQLGQCIWPKIYCSDLHSIMNTGKFTVCNTLRDGNPIYCAAVTNPDSCENIKQEFCNRYPGYIEFNNQIFETKLGSNSLGTFQCPKIN
jgi:hypothetical protein